jgi:hypothetical protein
MWQRLIAALRQIGQGLTRNTYGSCSGDPIAWEHDFLRRQREERASKDTSVVAPPASAAATASPTSRTRKTIALSVVLLLLSGSVAFAQRWWSRGGPSEPDVVNLPYDGRFTFARLKYNTAPGGDWYQGMASWAHGYPLSEDNLLRIMNEISGLGARVDGFNVFSLDDEELCRYPLAYLTEAGWWQMNEREELAFRNYLLKGGFVIFDDFKMYGQFGFGGGWEPFESNILRLFPGARFVDLDLSHPIFHSFFEIKSLTDFPQAYNAGVPVFRGLYEDNDPKKRLLMVVNYNTDISQFWEWSGRGLRPFDETNEAYKLGVNYVFYGLTH